MEVAAVIEIRPFVSCNLMGHTARTPSLETTQHKIFVPRQYKQDMKLDLSYIII